MSKAIMTKSLLNMTVFFVTTIVTMSLNMTASLILCVQGAGLGAGRPVGRPHLLHPRPGVCRGLEHHGQHLGPGLLPGA